MTLEQEIQDSIKKKLPQQVGDVLKIRLEQVDKDSAEVKRLDGLIGQYATEKAKTKTIYESNDQPNSSFGDYEYDVVDKDSILNVVDLDEFIV